jgi:cytochrome c-type biogenesis protein CcmH
MSESIEDLRHLLQQLQEQYSAGAIPKDSYEAEKVVLERRLLDQVMAAPPQEGNARWMFAGIATVALVVVAAGYWWTGSRAPTSMTAPMPGTSAMSATTTALPAIGAPAMAGSAPHGTETGQVASMVERLAQRLKDKPQDAEGWAMLARSYSVLGRHPEALKAYEKAIALRKDDANLLADYADSLAVQNNRVLAGEPLKLVERALKLEPHNLKALSMAGSEAFDRQDYNRAVKYWQQVVEFGPADSPMVQQVKPSLEHAQQLAGVPRTAKP